MIRYRTAKPEEIDEIIKLTDIIFRESRNLPPSMGRQFPTLFSCQNASNLYIAEDNGKIVSHIGTKKSRIMIYGHKISMASMGAVCTHPEYQGRGIGTRLLYETFNGLERDGVSVVTISGGRGLYRRNGAVEPGIITKFNVTQVLNIPEFEGMAYYIMNENDDISILSSVYHREAIRYERTKEEFNILFRAKPMVLSPDKTPFFAIVAYNTTYGLKDSIAYVIAFEEEGGFFDIVEYAGERMVVLNIINYLLDEKNVKGVSLTVQSHDRAMLGALKSLNVEGDTLDSSPITVRAINRDTLWEEIYPILKEKWVGNAMPKSLDDLPMEVTDDIAMLTSFLFREYDRPNYGGEGDGIFPLPLPWYRGLNYI